MARRTAVSLPRVSSSAPVRITAVVPTFSRPEELKSALASMFGQTRPPDRVIVVVNGARPDVVEWLVEQPVETVVLSHNSGAVGGFHAGLEAARTDAPDWIWLMDDDAVAEPDVVEQLLRAVEQGQREGRRVFGAAPTFLTPDGAADPGRFWGGVDPTSPAPNSRGRSADWAAFAGLLLRGNAYDLIGPLRVDFFMPYGDVEYGVRARVAGFELLPVPDAVVHHPAYPALQRAILGRRVEMMKLAPWRDYYEARNVAVMRRELRGTIMEDRTPTGRRLRSEFERCAATLLTDPHGGRRVAMRLLGWYDGRRGMMDRRVGPAG